MRRSDHVGPALALFVACAAATGCHRTPLPPTVTETETVVLTDLTLGGAPPPEAYAEHLEAHVSAVLDRMERCYATRVAARPGLGGEHHLELWVSARQVIRVTTAESTLADAGLERCIKESLLAYELPPQTPRGGVRVRFILAFTPPPPGRTLACTEDGCELVHCGEADEPCCPGAPCGAGD